MLFRTILNKVDKYFKFVKTKTKYLDTFVNMKLYTQEDALNEIFSQSGKELSAVMAVYKYRYKKGTLSQKTINKILTDNKFIIVQQAMYKQIGETDVRNSEGDIHITKSRRKKVLPNSKSKKN